MAILLHILNYSMFNIDSLVYTHLYIQQIFIDHPHVPLAYSNPCFYTQEAIKMLIIIITEVTT